MIYAISDLHLATELDKPMDIFGSGWDNHAERIQENWNSLLSDTDTIILPGDISWGIDLPEAMPDLRFIDALKGTKYISKGNHDYWWTTVSKMEASLVSEGISTIRFLHNNAFVIEDIIVAGTKGYMWDDKESADQNNKLINREVCRLENSLLQASKLKGDTDMEIVCFLHYPPVAVGQKNETFVEMLKKYGVKRCCYGHIHGAGYRSAILGEYENVNFSLISADYLKFSPILIK